MSVIYFANYIPVSDSVAEISRQEHALGRFLLMSGLKDLYQLNFDPDDESAMIAYDANGKPYLKDHPAVFFNITHCTGLAACAFHRQPVGIAAEYPGDFPEVLIKRALSDNEKELLPVCGSDLHLRQECFWRFWTLKEAYVKRTGVGVDTDLRSFSFSFDPGEPLRAGTTVSVACSDPAVSCSQVMTESGHIISLCADRLPERSPLDIVQYVDLSRQINKDYQGYHHPDR